MKFLLFLFISFLFSDSYQDCIEYTDKDTCVNQNSQLENANCCFISSNEEDPVCIDRPEFIEIINADKKTRPLLREFSGFNIFNDGEGSINDNQNQNKQANIFCKDFNTEVNYSEFIYFSNEEKDILQSEDHCFYYHFIEFDDNNTEDIKNLCKKGKFTKYAIDSGMKCAYVEITFDSKTKGSFVVKTCFPFIEEDAEVLNQFTKIYLDTIATEFDKEATYTFNAVVENQISISYDSKTGKLTNNNKKESKSEVIKIYYFLIILLILLF